MTVKDERDCGRLEVEAAVHRTILSILPAVRSADITPDKHLKDLGADSVDRVEIIMSLREQFSVNEPMATFSTIPNVGALIEVLREVAAR